MRMIQAQFEDAEMQASLAEADRIRDDGGAVRCGFLLQLVHYGTDPSTEIIDAEAVDAEAVDVAGSISVFFLSPKGAETAARLWSRFRGADYERCLRALRLCLQ